MQVSPQREELFQAELIATSRSDYENSIVDLENAKDDSKLLIGLSLYDDLMVLPNINRSLSNVDIAFAIDRGMANRMRLRQRKIDIGSHPRFDLIQTKSLNEFKGSRQPFCQFVQDNEKFTKM
ncbi:MAG: hypothetical protein R2727_01070 [Bacteroidales bacterium]